MTMMTNDNGDNAGRGLARMGERGRGREAAIVTIVIVTIVIKHFQYHFFKKISKKVVRAMQYFAVWSV